MLTAGLLEGTIISEQVESEHAATQEGVSRYRRAVADAIKRGQGGGLQHVGHYTAHWLQPCAAEIAKLKTRLRANEDVEGASFVAGPVLSVSSKRLALATIETTLSQMLLRPDGCPAQIVYHAIGSAVIAEAYMDELRKTKVPLPPNTPKHILERKQTETARAALERKWKTLTPGIVNQYARANLENEEYRARVVLHTGCNLFIALLGSASASAEGYSLAFRLKKGEVASKTGRTSKRQFIVMDRSIWNSISRASDARARLRPVHAPMLVPPYPWRMPEGDQPRIHGGYIRNRVPLVSHASREQRAAMDAGDMSRVYAAVNVLGSTKWRVNARIAGVQRWFMERGGNVGGLPRAEDAPMPARLPDDASPEEIKARNREAVRVKRENLKQESERTLTLYALGMAGDLAGRDAIYLPHQLDWRGRAYVIPHHLSHYGPDPRRALLEFAEPKMFGEDGRRWLLIAAANHFGIDKVGYDERIAWAESHHTEISESAMDPKRFRFWTTAKKPWQFLAACIAIEDPDHGMRYPVDVDGSCNGLQHYAAMLRDAPGGAQVNLTASGKPADIYTAVLDAVIPMLKGSWNRETRLAKILLPLMNRDVVKQPVMTTVYGVTGFGMRQQIRGRLREHLSGDDLHQCSRYLAGVVETAIGEIVKSAERAMRWLRERAEQLVDEGIAPAWTSPIGMPVVQPYRAQKNGKVVTVSGVFRFRKDDPTAPLRKWKQVRGLAPNFVHSVDASHMMRTAIECGKAGLDFASVHDSYRTHAASVSRMGEILRAEFVKMHEKPLLEDLAEQWRTRFSLDIHDPPKCGTLDLNEVLRSPYFFH